MYVTTVRQKGRNGKIYTSVLLRESYREDGKVKNRTLANLSKCPPEQIRALEEGLRNPDNARNFEGLEKAMITQGKSVGAVWVLHELAKRLGIAKALAPLGSSFQQQLALWQIISRVIQQGSRLSAVRLHQIHAIAPVLQLEQGFTEDDLYHSLHSLAENQNLIEDKLFALRSASGPFFWYDVTSSYFEGDQNVFAAYGYNRDQKKRKRQIVIGLLCRENGEPVSVEGFQGNTQDTETLSSQLDKLTSRFECKEIIIVGDRGAIRPKQIKEVLDRGHHFITALTLPQVEKLLTEGTLKLIDFDTDLKSTKVDAIRHIYRRNPERAKETQRARQERLATAQKRVDQQNIYLEGSSRRSPSVAKKNIQTYVKKLCIDEWVKISICKGRIQLTINQAALEEKQRLDGCYVWITDLSKNEYSDREIYDRYKDLKHVESAFRSMKTSFLKIRPIFVRTDASTRGHLFVVMLAYLLLRELERAWSHFNLMVEEGLELLTTVSEITIELNGQKLETVPKPHKEVAVLIDALNLKLPCTLPKVTANVVTRKQLTRR